MIDKIETIEDVKTFFRQLKYEDLNFHPDTPFEDYVNIGTNEPSYTIQESLIRNTLLSKCIIVCDETETDIYELGIEIFSIKPNLLYL